MELERAPEEDSVPTEGAALMIPERPRVILVSSESEKSLVALGEEVRHVAKSERQLLESHSHKRP